MFEIRKATVSDVPKIYSLINGFADSGEMLPRSLSELYDVIRSFSVAVPSDRPETLAGTCALHPCWEDLGEIRSLSVAREFQNSGLGRRLVEFCEVDGLDVGLHRIFVLTYVPDFFRRLDYRLIDKSELPQKIWADCFKCVKFPQCGEIALEKRI